MLVVTYRSDELHRRHPLRPLLAELERAAGVDRLALERFDRDELVEQLAGHPTAPPSARARRPALRRSRGNPLYTEELLAASEDGDAWLLPETLRDVLIARVERLSPRRRPWCASPPSSTGRSPTACSRRSPS